MSACKHISQLMLELLTAEEVKAISLGVIQQFNLDLKQCEGKRMIILNEDDHYGGGGGDYDDDDDDDGCEL